VREQLAAEIPGTLAKLSDAGFEGVELENAFGRSGASWKKFLDDAGLRACGFHHHFADLQGDALEPTIAFNQAIGNRNLIIRSLPSDVYESLDLLKETADAVNAVAEKLRPHGMRVGYHNHSADFNRELGDFWWNLFADRTSRDVILQLDTGNASAVPGVPLVALLERNAGRTLSMHVKPYSEADPDAYLGDDELDWSAIMTACETVGGIGWYIIEYERPGPPPVEALQANLERFRRLRA
jgi:sugar phosphate isomerase/epimerase